MPGGIGILGGTFNPIHFGHLRAAEELREQLGLDQVRLIPSAIPPHKEAPNMAPAPDRLRMVELALMDAPGCAASNIEINRPGPSYSVETLRTLRAELGPDYRLVFLIGFDAFREFASWKEYAAIFALCDVAVMTRPPWPDRLALKDLPIATREAFRYDKSSESFCHSSGRRVQLARITALDISATAIRSAVAAGRSIRFLVPPAVADYIATHRLYRRDTAR